MNTGKYFTLSVITLLSLLWGCTQPVQQPTGPTVNKPEAESLAGTTTVASMPGSHKRGVSFGIKNVTDAFILSNFICWHYNWGNTPSGPDNVQLFLEQNNIDYCPMCWNGNYSKDRIRAFVRQVDRGDRPQDIDGSGRQGLEAQKVIHCAIESLNTGKIVYVDEMYPKK